MNLYFLVEGRSTEKKVYPKFISHFIGEGLTRVSEFDEVDRNNYFLISGNGYPRILSNVLKNSIQDINSINKYDYLIICIDADDNNFKQRQEEVNKYLKEFEENEIIKLIDSCELILIVQNRCIETWFLANEKIYKANPQSIQLKEYQDFYNVKVNDPESLPLFEGFDTHANFHFTYLRELLLERNIRYSKNHPREVADPYYLEELTKRCEKTNHLGSFKRFIEFCEMVKEKL
jgi:hypothetical protein